MADKKITALDALDAAGKATDDLLHIIDFGTGSAPINKKITVANLFSRVDTPLTSIGAFNLDFGPASTISALKVNIPNVSPSNSNRTEVVINDNANQHVDFRVEQVFHLRLSLLILLQIVVLPTFRSTESLTELLPR